MPLYNIMYVAITVSFSQPVFAAAEEAGSVDACVDLVGEIDGLVVSTEVMLVPITATGEWLCCK